jgi:hypothetical protein
MFLNWKRISEKLIREEMGQVYENHHFPEIRTTVHYTRGATKLTIRAVKEPPSLQFLGSSCALL